MKQITFKNQHNLFPKYITHPHMLLSQKLAVTSCRRELSIYVETTETSADRQIRAESGIRWNNSWHAWSHRNLISDANFCRSETVITCIVLLGNVYSSWTDIRIVESNVSRNCCKHVIFNYASRSQIVVSILRIRERAGVRSKAWLVIIAVIRKVGR